MVQSSGWNRNARYTKDTSGTYILNAGGRDGKVFCLFLRHLFTDREPSHISYEAYTGSKVGNRCWAIITYLYLLYLLVDSSWLRWGLSRSVFDHRASSSSSSNSIVNARIMRWPPYSSGGLCRPSEKPGQSLPALFRLGRCSKLPALCGRKSFSLSPAWLLGSECS